MFAPLSTLALELAWTDRGDFPTLEELSALAASRGVITASGLSVRFAPSMPRPRRRRSAAPAYEQIIQETGAVPTRARNWHDLFNALIWVLFPRTKAALNAGQIACAVPRDDAELRSGRIRTREQDRLAMFDEGGLLLAVQGEDIIEAVIFGHAILEEAVAGRIAAHAKPLRVEVSTYYQALPASERYRYLDEAAAHQIAAGEWIACAAPAVPIAPLFRGEH